MNKLYYLKLLPERKRNPKKMATFVCERCGKKFQKEFWYIKKGRRFCSHACRTQDPLKTLLSRIEKQPNGCWNYTGNVDFGGYGQIKIGGVSRNTHRVMWALWNKKPVPEGMVVRHTCIGNRRCINPDHLIIGTQKENVQDTIRNGRYRNEAFFKFQHDVVRQIRSMRKPSIPGTRIRVKPSYKEMAAMFNTTDSAIYNIVNLKTYKRVV